VLSVALLCAQETRADLESAVAELQRAVHANPSDAQAHGKLGILYRRMGMPAQAAESLERAVRLQPDPRLNVLLAFTYMEGGRHRDAIPLLASGFEAEQKDAVKSVVGQRLVECYLATGGEERALPILQALRQIAPDDPNVLYLASKVYMNLWNGAFQRMVAKAPASYQVRLIQAEALESQERFAEAAGEYRQILKLSPKIAGIHYRLGRAILRSRPAEEADQEAAVEFRRELEINPGDVRALADLGEIHLKKSQPEEAERSFLQAIKLQPGYVPARIGLGKVLIGRKRWSEALEQLETAVKLAPEEQAVHYNLMLAYRGLGRMEDAKRASDTFQRLKDQNRGK
jgi:tetratricopeptide (TPR) repeat protein